MGQTGFYATYSLESAAADAKFTTDKAKTDTPTQSLTLIPHVKSGVIKYVGLHIDWTNAVTLDGYYIFEDDIANNEESKSRLIYEMPSGTLPSDDDEVKVYDLDIPFVAGERGKLYYATDWSGAPGNCLGYYRIAGVGFI